eukprot:jgi/Astpho2/1473/Aster-05359
MAPTRTVMVCGATGTQGGGVVEALLHAGGFQVRGLTRNKASPAAQKLKTAGVEVVQGDLSDPSSLREAFKGADYLFIVTDEGGDQAYRLLWSRDVRAFSSILDSLPEACPGYKIPHYECKAQIREYLMTKSTPFTTIYT